MRLRSGRRVRTAAKAKAKAAKSANQRKPAYKCVSCDIDTKSRWTRVDCEHTKSKIPPMMCGGCAREWYKTKFVEGEYMRCFAVGCDKIVCHRSLFTDEEQKARVTKMEKRKKDTIPEEMRFLHETGRFQMCPRCRIPVERDGGCPVMTCPHCSVYFDYETGVAFP